MDDIKIKFGKGIQYVNYEIIEWLFENDSFFMFGYRVLWRKVNKME